MESISLWYRDSPDGEHGNGAILSIKIGFRPELSFLLLSPSALHLSRFIQIIRGEGFVKYRRQRKRFKGKPGGRIFFFEKNLHRLPHFPFSPTKPMFFIFFKLSTTLKSGMWSSHDVTILPKGYAFFIGCFMAGVMCTGTGTCLRHYNFSIRKERKKYR